MCGPESPDLVAQALTAITKAISVLAAPNELCPVDGCLIAVGEDCPACRSLIGPADDAEPVPAEPTPKRPTTPRRRRPQARTRPRLCACGMRIRLTTQDSCHGCRRKVPRPPCTGCGKWVRVKGEDRCHACRSLTSKPPCTQCGRQIRAVDQTVCAACRRNERRNTIPEEEDTRPVTWIRRGLVWHPVYEQSEVA